MADYPGLLLGAGMIFALGIAEIVFTIWVFRLPFSQRDQVQNKIVRFFFKKIALMKDQPDGYRTSQRTLGFICIGNIAGDLLGVVILGIAGWDLIGGRDGELVGLILVWILAPFMALHAFFFGVIGLLSLSSYRRYEREQLLGHDLLDGK